MALLLLYASLLLAAVPLPQMARAYPDGPPVSAHYSDKVCNLMMPSHDDHKPIASTGGYSIETDIPRNGHIGFNYTAGKDYTGKNLRKKERKGCMQRV